MQRIRRLPLTFQNVPLLHDKYRRYKSWLGNSRTSTLNVTHNLYLRTKQTVVFDLFAGFDLTRKLMR